MNSLAKFDQLNLDPAAKTEVAALIQSLIEQNERDAKLIQTKYAALTYELAYYQRIRFSTIRFSTKSETLAPCNGICSRKPENPISRRLMRESSKQLRNNQPCGTVARPQRPGAGRQPLPSPRIEHRHESASCTCGTCGKDLVKIGEDVSEQLDVEPGKFLCIGIFVRNRLAGLAKASRQRRFLQRSSMAAWPPWVC